MIYPTRTAVALTAAGAPVALAAAVLAEGLWAAGAAWSALIVLLVLVDGLLSRIRRAPLVELHTPTSVAVGGAAPARIAARFSALFAPRRAELLLESDELVEITPRRLAVKVEDGVASGQVMLRGLRRGEALFERLWVRWTGPLGLVWAQTSEAVDRAQPVTPNIAAIKNEALRMFSRDALHGMKAQIETGEGTEFHALRDFLPGMDRRSIDWKQSARHGKLVAQEKRVERNHTIVLALDGGRTMCEPVDGMPRIDRAINAALLLAYVGLASGDRVGVFGFDARPRLSTGAVAGVHSFGLIQRLLARLDYSAEETNYTLGLTTLAGDLDRRSLVIVFTEFTDAIGAELMLENLRRLLKKHVVMFVVMRDHELEDLVRREPYDPADIARAVTAGALLREREVVLNRLRRLGVQLVEAPVDGLGPALVNGYLDVKRRSLL